MAVDEWSGICACGNPNMDGVKCRLGATHQTLEMSRAADRERNPHLYPPMPWATSSTFPWDAQPAGGATPQSAIAADTAKNAAKLTTEIFMPWTQNVK